MLLSSSPAAMDLPSGAKATQLTAAARVSFLISLASAAFQISSTLSAPPPATWVPAGSSATHDTPSVWPAKGRSTCPVVRFHRRTCLSPQPVSSGEQFSRRRGGRRPQLHAAVGRRRQRLIAGIERQTRHRAGVRADGGGLLAV